VSSRDRGRRSARLVALGCTVGLAIGLAATVAGAVASGPVAGPVKVRAFSISGSAHNLYPGVNAPLVLTVKDDRSFALTVLSVTTTVRKSAGGCPASVLSVSPFTGNLRLQPGQTGTVQVTITMARTAPRACQGRSFLFDYHGLAGAP
jgi:hypothetical protein